MQPSFTCQQENPSLQSAMMVSYITVTQALLCHHICHIIRQKQVLGSAPPQEKGMSQGWASLWVPNSELSHAEQRDGGIYSPTDSQLSLVDGCSWSHYYLALLTCSTLSKWMCSCTQGKPWGGNPMCLNVWELPEPRGSRLGSRAPAALPEGRSLTDLKERWRDNTQVLIF